MEQVAAVCLGLSVLAFGWHALRTWPKVSLVWIGVAFLVAGVYFVPVLYVAFA